MESNIIVSIIMPIFNVEAYLHRSIESVLKQSVSNIELILIDDGSTDASRSVMEEYRDDKRVKIIFQKNEGTGAARNRGLKVAVGKYIYFMDPDDWIEGEMVLDNWKLLDMYHPDILIFGYYDHHGNRVSYQNIEDRTINSRKEFLQAFPALFQSGILYTLWNKLYKKELLDDFQLIFGTEKNGQDYLFNLSVYDKVGSMVLNSNKYYHYVVKRPGAATARFHMDIYYFYKKEQKKLINFLKRNNIYSETIVSDRWYFILNSCWKKALLTNDIVFARNYIDQIVKEYIECDYIKIKNLSYFKSKIKYRFFFKYRIFKLFSKVK
ncbi:glycosyltransferase family 2 protein [Leuconostoc citreum]|uniref:glycosyltransferase family 2 protein n=1 Tax=Leuconostoc citreum TaxID=33964 RepID=UPI001303B03D|nr:glycosyltransferase family 2 protein [Leuconostoc citreum]